MAQRFAYGDSYGGVAQHELALDAGRDSRYFNSLNQQRALEQMLAQREQAEFANALAVAQLAENSNRYRGEQQYRNQATQSSFLDRLLANKQFYDELASRERTAGLNFRAGQARESARTADADYSEAAEMIGQGMPPEQVNRLFQLQPPQQNRLAALFSMLARQEEEELAPIETSGRAHQSAIQAALDNARRMKAESEALQRFTPFTRNSTIKERVAKTPLEQLPMLDTPAFNSFIQQMILKEKLDSMLRGDPATQRIEMIPQPRRFRSFTPPGLDDVSNLGLAPTAPAAGMNALPAAGPIMPSSRAEFAALPKGALYINPADGKVYRKK